jgi:hypothetical protein
MAALRGPSHQNPVIISGILIWCTYCTYVSVTNLHCLDTNELTPSPS